MRQSTPVGIGDPRRRPRLADNKRQLAELVEAFAPGLQDRLGVGPVSGGQLLVSWSHHGRRHEAAFAALAGVSPVPASSGRTHRHRLNRGGDRHLNRALHDIVLTRWRMSPAPTPALLPAGRKADPTPRSAAHSSATPPANSSGCSTPQSPIDKHRSVLRETDQNHSSKGINAFCQILIVRSVSLGLRRGGTGPGDLSGRP
ncbi:IS110 family transposase [Mycolicibacterium smegmatis]|nr:IS110 family transposase [Mycolicibacterium smegmatis]